MDFKHILHNKLFLYGGGIILLLALYMHLKGSNAAVGNGVTTSTTTQPTDAQVAAQVSLAQAQIGAASAANTTAAQVAIQTQGFQEALAEKTIDASVAKYSLDATVATTTAQIQAASIAQERDDNLQASIAKWTLDQSTALQTANNNFQLAYATQANSTTIANAQIIAGVNLASIQAQRDLGIATIQGSVAQTTSVISGQVAMNDSNNAAKVSEDNIQAGVTKYTQGSGNIKSIFGTIGSIFSDRRLKRDVVIIGMERDGLGVYSYRYADSRSQQIGVMADEVKRIRPRAMGPRVMGYDTVNYAAL